MQAIVLREVGPSEGLRIETVPDPIPGPGEVVVRLLASALNHRDVWIRKGQYAGITFPAILGSDGCGVVEEIGEGVEPSLVGRRVVIDPGLEWGDDPRSQGPKFRVLGMPDDGTYAEKIRIPAGNVHDAPANLSDYEAAAIPLAALTAYRALVTRARLALGETVLITGIGGGVSAFGLQIAKALGARVIVASRHDAKLAAAAALGADAGVNVTDPNWPKLAVKLTGGEGPDVVLDSVGGETFAKALAAVRRGGRIVTYGATSGPVEKFELTRLFWKQVDILGSTMGTPSEFAAMLAMVRQGAIQPTVARVFALSEASAAHRYLEESNQFGKVVLDPQA